MGDTQLNSLSVIQGQFQAPLKSHALDPFMWSVDSNIANDDGQNANIDGKKEHTGHPETWNERRVAIELELKPLLQPEYLYLVSS